MILMIIWLKIHRSFKWECHLWSGMLQRCYASDYTRINPSYEDVFVEEFLHGYEDFYEFVNTKKGFKLGYEMDKDLLVRGCRVYARDTISFIPKIINVAIQGGKSKVKLELPVGVFYRKDTKKYRAISGEYGKLVHCGQFNNPEDAFFAYKKSKERYLKELANLYKDTIDLDAYEALMNYEVLITD